MNHKGWSKNLKVGDKIKVIKEVEDLRFVGEVYEITQPLSGSTYIRYIRIKPTKQTYHMDILGAGDYEFVEEHFEPVDNIYEEEML
jgi:hypothetical protein